MFHFYVHPSLMEVTSSLITHLKGGVISNSQPFFFYPKKKRIFGNFERTVLRALWSDFKFPKTAYIYFSRFLCSKNNWGSRCYWAAAIYLPKPSTIVVFYCNNCLTIAMMHRWFLRSDHYFSFQIKWKQLLTFFGGLRSYLDCDSVRFWIHYRVATWSLWS